MDFAVLSEAAYGLIRPYEGPDMESPEQLETRIGKTLDELPDVYAWILQLHAFFDHWTEFNANQFGQKSMEYKDMRIKRDLMKNVASAAKLRYDGTSRRLTQIHKHEDEAKMARHRG